MTFILTRRPSLAIGFSESPRGADCCCILYRLRLILQFPSFLQRLKAEHDLLLCLNHRAALLPQSINRQPDEIPRRDSKLLNLVGRVGAERVV